MRKITPLFAASLALVVSACGGGDISETTASETNAEETMQAAEEGGAMLPNDGGAMAPAAGELDTNTDNDSEAVDQSIQDALADAEREADAVADDAGN